MRTSLLDFKRVRWEGPQHRSRNRAGILEARSVVASLYSAVCRAPEAGGTQVDG